MLDPDDPLAAVHKHLAAALSGLSECFPVLDPARQKAIVRVAREVTRAERQLARCPAAVVIARPPGESEDERIERRAAEAAARVEALLDGLLLTDDERAFAHATGERMVDLVTDAFRDTVRDGLGFDGGCVTAAVAVALIIVHDPPDDGPP